MGFGHLVSTWGTIWARWREGWTLALMSVRVAPSSDGLKRLPQAAVELKLRVFYSCWNCGNLWVWWRKAWGSALAGTMVYNLYYRQIIPNSLAGQRSRRAICYYKGWISFCTASKVILTFDEMSQNRVHHPNCNQKESEENNLQICD